MRATTQALLFFPMVFFPTILAADTFTGPYPYTVDGIGYAYTENLSNFSAAIQVYFSAPVSYYEFSVVFDRGDVNPQVYLFTGCSDCTSTVTWSELPPYVPGGALATVSGTAPDVTQMSVTLAIDPSTPAAVGSLDPLGFAFTDFNSPPSTGISQVDAPEPATLVPAGLALLALALFRRSLWITAESLSQAPYYFRCPPRE